MAAEHDVHVPVLRDEAVRWLAVQPGGRYVDCTIGTGGHAEAILEAAEPGGLLLGLDADGEALATAAKRLQRFSEGLRLANRNFRHLEQACREQNFLPVHGILFDLGLSSLQLASPERGFSFQLEGPLDMRFGTSQDITAATILNDYTETELANLIWRYGEERQSRRIARAIVRARPLATTSQLAEIVARAVGKRGRLHPATRSFQALRIAVNDEPSALEDALGQALAVLGSGGRLVAISYHSLEDRIVKQFMQRESRDCVCPPGTPQCVCEHRATLRRVVTSAIRPSAEEVHANPRARSARMRVAEKLSEGSL